MREIILDGREMISKEEAHLHIKERLQSPEYHGNNLDALWDVISSYSESIEISLRNKEELIENLGRYGNSLIQVFQDAQKENYNVKFKIIEN